MAKRLKRPRDPLSLAKLIGDIATGQVADQEQSDGRDPAAMARGKSGGVKGGAARARALTADQRAEIARAAAGARWNKS